jgi:16S rRNA (guanine966-N2)-methyltransferase
MASRSKRSSSKQERHRQLQRGRAGRVRIISGDWRGRYLKVENIDGLRPTGDRTKEMLFNWLQHDIAGSACLDLFAGSGGLGFEAASRYAKHVTLVEREIQAARQLTVQIKDFEASERISLITSSAEQFLNSNTRQYDLVFLDPPFDSNLLSTVLPLLVSHLLRNAMVYIESEFDQPIEIPSGFTLLKEKRLGEVMARLYCFDGGLE